MSIDLSRVENILETMLGRSEIKEPAQSRVEELLIELKEAIEEGGTGGDITALTARIAKCERDISSIETVDETQAQQIQSIVTTLGEFRTAIENLDTDVENKADKSTTYTKTEVDTALGAKQDTISDLATIRSGATAVQPVSGKGLSTNDFTDAEKTKLDNHVVDTSNPHQVTKAQVGLGNVDNTSDADKPISAAVQAPLARLIDAGAKNLLNLVTPTTINRMTITNAGNGSVTASCSNVTWANSGYELSLTAGKAYKFLVYVDSANVSDVQFQCFLNDVSGDTSQELGKTSRITSPGVYSVDFVATTKIRVGINLNNSGTAATGSATYRAMLCTAEDYAISPEVVPYRPSYDELVARIEALERAGE